MGSYRAKMGIQGTKDIDIMITIPKYKTDAQISKNNVLENIISELKNVTKEIQTNNQLAEKLVERVATPIFIVSKNPSTSGSTVRFVQSAIPQPVLERWVKEIRTQ